MTAVLRSWEDRFGARLLRLGFASLQLLVERPPQTNDQALRVAAELFDVSSELRRSDGEGVSSVREMAKEIQGKPIWRFWWD